MIASRSQPGKVTAGEAAPARRRAHRRDKARTTCLHAPSCRLRRDADMREQFMNGCVSRLVSTVLITASSLAVSDSAWAKVRPYSARGTAQFVSPTDFV